jgi:hypothetical protein
MPIAFTRPALTDYRLILFDKLNKIYDNDDEQYLTKIPTTEWRLWKHDFPSGRARLWRLQCFKETEVIS